MAGKPNGRDQTKNGLSNPGRLCLLAVSSMYARRMKSDIKPLCRQIKLQLILMMVPKIRTHAASVIVQNEKDSFRVLGKKALLKSK